MGRLVVVLGMFVVGCGAEGPGLDGHWDRVDKPVSYTLSTAYGLYQRWEYLDYESGAFAHNEGGVMFIDKCGVARTVTYAVDGDTLVLDGATFKRTPERDGGPIGARIKPCQ